MYCSKCGAQLMEDERFCANCGTPIENGTSVSDKNSIAAENTRKDPSTAAREQSDSSPKKNIVGLIVSICAAIVVIAVVIIVIVLIKRSRGDSAVSGNGETTTQAIINTENETYDNLDTMISDYFASDDFKDLSDEDKIARALELLDDAYEKGLIQDKAVYDEESNIISFTYADGTLGGISFNEFNDEFNGVGGDTSMVQCEAKHENVQYAAKVVPQDEIQILVLNAFENTVFRREFYQKMQNEIQLMGFSMTLDEDVTVADYRNLLGYDIIVFATHGTMYNDYPALCLQEVSTAEKDKEYAKELTQDHSIAKVYDYPEQTFKYYILPDFFTVTYGDEGVPAQLIYSESCCSMGINGTIDYSLADAILGSSDGTFIGNNNPIMAEYSRNRMEYVVESMLLGYYSGSIFEESGLVYGTDDSQNGSGGNNGTPILRGSSETVLYEHLEDTTMDYDQVKAAYLEVLESNKDKITNAAFSHEEDIVSFADVYGDSTEEMMFVAYDGDDNFGNGNMYIYTYIDGEAVLLCKEPWTEDTQDSYGYLYFTTSESDNLYMFSSYENGSGIYVDVSIFVPEQESLSRNERFSYSISYNNDGNTSSWEGKYYIGSVIDLGKSVIKEISQTIYGDITGICACYNQSWFIIDDILIDDEMQASCKSMSYADAVRYLGGTIAESDSSWKEAYQEFLSHQEYLSDSEVYADYEELTENNRIGIALYDMDNDGIPELLINNGAEAWAVQGIVVYTFIDGSVKKAGCTFQGDPFTTGSDTYPGFFVKWYHTAYYEAKYYYLEDGELKSETVSCCEGVLGSDGKPTGPDTRTSDEDLYEYYTYALSDPKLIRFAQDWNLQDW